LAALDVITADVRVHDSVASQRAKPRRVLTALVTSGELCRDSLGQYAVAVRSTWLLDAIHVRESRAIA
jgi:hypothetical protein